MEKKGQRDLGRGGVRRISKANLFDRKEQESTKGEHRRKPYCLIRKKGVPITPSKGRRIIVLCQSERGKKEGRSRKMTGLSS